MKYKFLYIKNNKYPDLKSWVLEAINIETIIDYFTHYDYPKIKKALSNLQATLTGKEHINTSLGHAMYISLIKSCGKNTERYFKQDEIIALTLKMIIQPKLEMLKTYGKIYIAQNGSFQPAIGQIVEKTIEKQDIIYPNHIATISQWQNRGHFYVRLGTGEDIGEKFNSFLEAEESIKNYFLKRKIKEYEIKYKTSQLG